MSLSLDELQQHHLTALQHDYQQLLETAGFDGVLIYSGAARPHYADDQYPAFNAYGHFLHWVPLVDAQHCWLLIQPGRRPLLKVHAPDDYWHLPTRLPEEPWCEAFEIVLSNDTAPPPCPTGQLAVIGDIDPANAGQLPAAVNPPALLTALDERRMHKSAYEVACLVEANRLALKGHHAARQCFAEGGAELDIHLAYLAASRQRESRLPYDSIVGINRHAGVLHYQHYESHVPTKRHSLLVDAGHRYRGYCADITRTWAGPQAPDLFASLIASLHTLRQALIDDCAPEVDFVELHQRMHHGLGERLQQHGLVHCSAEAAVVQGITRAFCPHGLGHPLGLQVHDVAGKVDSHGHPLPAPQAHPALRLTRRLTPGMVVTIEPGCYVIPMLLEPLRQAAAGSDIDWDLVESLTPCGGIRVEDNILITEDGHHNLTATAALALFD